MRYFLIAGLSIGLMSATASAQTPSATDVIDYGADDRALKQTEEFAIPVSELWQLYTTGDGVSRWMAPVAEVDLRPGGSIRTNYDPCATIGDPGTITLSIVAYVPETYLLLQADLEPQEQASWMTAEIFENRHRLYNLIAFEPVDGGGSRLTSWGLGYGQGEEWATMVTFFEQGNAWSYAMLRKAIAGEAAMKPCEATTE